MIIVCIDGFVGEVYDVGYCCWNYFSDVWDVVF